MFKNKKSKLMLALASVSLLAAACGNDDDTNDNNASGDAVTEITEDVVIDFWHMYTDGVMADEVLPEVIAQFEEDNPHIKVNHLGTNFFDYWTKLNTAIAGNVAPDLAMNDSSTVVSRAMNGTIVPLNQFIEADDFDTSVYYPVLMDAMEYEGDYYGIANDTDVRVLYWNKDHFEEAGLDPDTPPANWDELKEFTEILTKRNDDGSIQQMGFTPDMWLSNIQVHTLAWTNGGDFWDDDMNPTFMEPENLEAVEFIKHFQDFYGVEAMSAFRSEAGVMDHGPFIEGRLSMVMDVGNLTRSIIRENPDMNYGIATLPYEDEPVTYSAGFNYEIIDNDDSLKARASWEFLKYITSEDVQKRFVEETGSLSSNRLAAEADEFMEDENWAAIVAQMEHARFIEFIPEHPNWNGTLVTVQEAVLSDGVPVEEAMQEAQNQAEQAVNQ